MWALVTTAPIPARIIAYDFTVEDDYHQPWGEGYEMHF